MFNRLKRWRAVATRFDKLQVRYEASVKIAAIDDWIVAVVRAGQPLASCVAVELLRRRRGRRPSRPAPPDHAVLVRLIGELNTSDNTFFVVYPDDDELDWSIAVSKNISAFGGFEIDRTDPATSEQTTTTAADPYTIADDVLAWVNQR